MDLGEFTHARRCSERKNRCNLYSEKYFYTENSRDEIARGRRLKPTGAPPSPPVIETIRYETMLPRLADRSFHLTFCIGACSVVSTLTCMIADGSRSRWQPAGVCLLSDADSEVSGNGLISGRVRVWSDDGRTLATGSGHCLVTVPRQNG